MSDGTEEIWLVECGRHLMWDDEPATDGQPERKYVRADIYASVVAQLAPFQTPAAKALMEAGDTWARCDDNTPWRELGRKTDALERAAHTYFRDRLATPGHAPDAMATSLNAGEG